MNFIIPVDLFLATADEDDDEEERLEEEEESVVGVFATDDVDEVDVEADDVDDDADLSPFCFCWWL